MEIKTIKGKEHILYDNNKEFTAFKPDLVVMGDWRRGTEGDWVYTDDLHVCQVLKVFYITVPSTKKQKKCIRTVCGSFVASQKMLKCWVKMVLRIIFTHFRGTMIQLTILGQRRHLLKNYYLHIMSLQGWI